MLAAVGVVALGAVVGCGDGSDDAAGRQEPTPSTTNLGDPASHLQGPRSPIADGLVVPTGAKLAGEAFREVPRDLSDEESGLTAPAPGTSVDDLPWEALLVIDGDPFAVFDDLAGQIRGDAIGLPMPGTADSCIWVVADPGPSDPGEGPVAGMGEPVEVTPEPTSAGGAAPSGGPTEGFQSDGQGEIEMAELRAEIVAESPPPDDVTGVSCQASVEVAEPGGSRRIELELSADDRVPATITVRGSHSDQAPIAPGATAQVTTKIGQTTSSGVGPEPGPDRVPAGKANDLPVFAGQPVGAAGDAFGPDVNCFIEGGYRRMQVPVGAVLVGGGWDGGAVSVLAVDDAEAVTAAIARQVEGPSRSPDSEISRDDYELADGRTISQYSHAVAAGGGGCSVTTSPDGRYLRVSAHGD